MYKKIINPETGRAVNVNGRIGKSVLRKYVSNNIRGGGFFDNLVGNLTGSSDEPDYNSILMKIKEAMTIAQTKEREWSSLNIDESTKMNELDLLRENMKKLVDYDRKVREHPNKVQNEEQKKNQSSMELESCNQKLEQTKQRCESLEKTKIDTDTKYDVWLNNSSAKLGDTIPQVDDIIENIMDVDERLTNESKKKTELESKSSDMSRDNMNRGDLGGMMTNESMYNNNIGYGSTAYDNTAYGNNYNVYGNQAYGNQVYGSNYNAYGGSKKNNKKTKKSNKKNSKRK